MSFDISVSFATEPEGIELSHSGLTHVVRTTLEARKVESACVSLVVTDHDTLRDLNRAYLDHNYNTDVLSFLLSDSDAPLLDGEVYVDVETAIERCSEFGTSPVQELNRYVIHGVLHLTGLDDSTTEQRAEMTGMENQILTLILSE